MLRLDQQGPENDEVRWRSAFMNYITWLLRLPRSKNLRARSWLIVADGRGSNHGNKLKYFEKSQK